MFVNKSSKAFIIMLILISLSACNRLSNEEVIANTKELIANHELSEAEVSLKSFIQKNRNDNQARALLGDVHALQGEYLLATEQYSRVPLSTLKRESYERYIEAEYFLGNFTALTTLYDNYPRDINKPIDYSDLIVSIVEIKLNNENNELLLSLSDSDSVFDKPVIRKLTSALAALQQQKDYTSFAKEILALADDAGNNEEGWFLNYIIADTAYNTNEFATSTKHFEKFIELRPGYLTTYFFLAQSYIKEEKFDKAMTIVDKLLKVSSANAFANQLKAVLTMQNNDIERTKVHIEKAITNGLSTRANNLLAGVVNFRLENYEQSINYLHRGIQDLAGVSEYQGMLNYARAITGDSSLIDQYSKEKIDSLADIENLKLIVSGLVATGNNSAVQELVRKSVDTDSLESAEILESLLSFTDLSSQEAFDQLSSTAFEIVNSEQYKKAEYSDIRSKAKIIVITTLLKDDKDVLAQNYLDTWIREKPRESVNYNIKAEYLNANGDFTGALSALKNVNKNDRGALYYRTLSVNHYELKNYQEALENSKLALQMSPYSIGLLSNLYQISKVVGTDESDWVKDFYSNYQSIEQNMLMVANYLAYDKQYDNALAIIKDANISLRSYQTHLLTARLMIVNNNKAGATKPLNSLASNSIVPANELKEVTRFMQDAGETRLAINLLERHANLYPDSQDLKNMLNVARIKNKDYSTVINALESTDQLNIRNQLLLAYAYFNSGKLQEGIELYKSLYSTSPNDNTLVPYVNALYTLGQEDDALSILNSHVNSNPNDMIAKLLLATKTEGSRAIALYEEVIAAQPNNFRALSNIAYLLKENGEVDNAKQYIDRAFAILPNNETIIALKEEIDGLN